MARKALPVVWFFLAAVIFLTTWSLALPVLVVTLLIALAFLVGSPSRVVLIVAACAAAAFGVWGVSVVPSTPGWEYAGGLLALTAFATALYTIALVGPPEQAPVSRDIARR